MSTDRIERVQVVDGALDGFLAVPDSGGGPVVLLLHEIRFLATTLGG